MAHIHSAARRGDVEAVARELAGGTDVNATSINGNYPLTLAASGNHLAVVRLLLESGADPNSADGTGRTALHNSASNDFCEILTAVLQAGADPACADAYGRTPLHIAAARGDLQIATVLLAAGAPLEAICRAGRTPLVDAIINDEHDMVALLRRAGADESAYRGAESWLGADSERLHTMDRLELAVRELRILGLRPHEIEQMLTPDRIAKLQADWAEFIADMETGDELWWFASPKDDWTYFAGRAGYALVRQGRPFKRKIVSRN